MTYEGMDLHCRVEERWQERDTTYVWFYYFDGPNLHLVYPDRSEKVSKIGGPLDRQTPSLKLPTSFLRVLIHAGSDLLPSDRQMAEHLKDAQVVRDRLLVLIERKGL